MFIQLWQKKKKKDQNLLQNFSNSTGFIWLKCDVCLDFKISRTYTMKRNMTQLKFITTKLMMTKLISNIIKMLSEMTYVLELFDLLVDF